jgi:hypothetical protein
VGADEARGARNHLDCRRDLRRLLRRSPWVSASEAKFCSARQGSRTALADPQLDVAGRRRAGLRLLGVSPWDTRSSDTGRTSLAGGAQWWRRRLAVAREVGEPATEIPACPRLPFSAALHLRGFCRRVLRCSETFHTRNMSLHREEVLLRWCPSPVAIASKGRVVDRWTWNV